MKSSTIYIGLYNHITINKYQNKRLFVSMLHIIFTCLEALQQSRLLFLNPSLLRNPLCLQQ